MVKPTMKPPCVEPSGRSKSSAASEMDTLRRLTNGIARIRSPTSCVCFNQFTARLASERSFTTARDSEPCRVEAVPASSSRHCRASKIENLPRLAVLSSLHRTLYHSCPSIAHVVTKLVVVLKLRSGNCVKWRPPKKDGPSCNNRCHFPNLILCRCLSMLS